MTRRTLRRTAAALVCAALSIGAAACSSPDSPPTVPQDAWPDPPKDRPVVDLAFSVGDDLSSASGTETVAFTPNREICELVFRAWPNKPATARTGNSLTVRTVTVDGASLPLSVSAGGAPSGAPGTLVTAALPSCSPGGQTVTASLTFDLRLGARTDERIGYSPRTDVAWLGSAYPMLAWTRNAGWVRDDGVDVVGDVATSEAFQLRSLEVEASSSYNVAGMGVPDEPRPAAEAGKTVHRFSADVVRDVTVSVGEIDLTTTQAGDTAITVALPRQGRVKADAQEWTEASRSALDALSRLLGPVPADHIWLSVLPHVSEGVEFGQAVQFADVNPAKDQWLVAHELAHMWFYGLVGNDQALSPWLDESFATYAQEVVAPAGLTTGRRHVVDGAVGEPMSAWAQRPRPDSAYVDTVYGAGGQALLDARKAAGTESFDAAIHEYLRRHAWGIATPEDVADALADLPAARDVLRTAGAIR